MVLKIKRTVIPVFGIIISLYLLFSMPENISEGITKGLEICFYTILPSLFPFMVLSSYIIRSDILSPLNRFFSPITRTLFKQPKCCAPVILMSLTGGFPIGAKMTDSLLKNGKITENQAQRLNLFCVNCGPAFAVTAVGSLIYNCKQVGIIIYVSLCLSSIITGIFTSFLDDGQTIKNSSCSKCFQSPLVSLSGAVGDSVQSVLSVCSWIVIFNAVSNCIKSAQINRTLYLALSCILEVTGGCSVASQFFPIPVVCAVVGFGGFCVHCQILSFIRSSNLKYKLFFAFRTLNAALSALICKILLTVFPVDISVSLTDKPLNVAPFSVSLPAFFAITVMCIVMIFDIDDKKKIW